MYQMTIYGVLCVRAVISVSLDEATVKLLDQLMKQYKSSKSQIIRMALWNLLKNESPQTIGEVLNNFIEYMEKLTNRVENLVREAKMYRCDEEIARRDETIEKLMKENEELRKKNEELSSKIEELEKKLNTVVEVRTGTDYYDSFALEMIRDIRLQIGKKSMREMKQELIILAKILNILEDGIKNLRIPSLEDILRKLYT